MRVLVVFLAALVLAGSAVGSVRPPPVDARAYEVVDAATGEVLAARNADARLPVASITKLMTVLVTLGRAGPGDVVTVSPDAVGVGGSTVQLRSGERITVRDLVAAALVQSANDAATALAEHVGRGDQGAFVALMNGRAQALGLRDTRFVRPDGLDAPGQVSSARDATRLARVVMRLPAVRRIVRMRTAAIAGGRTLHTWNDLLARFPGLLGVKTGHTSAAGWCQVAAARGRGVTVYATILGSPTRAIRNEDLAELLAWGLARYRLVPVIARRRAYASVDLPYGKPRLALVAERPLRRPIRHERPLVERVVAPGALELPVRRGARLGEVRVYDRRRLVARSPLVAARSVSTPGIADKLGWYAERTLHGLGDLFS